MISPNPKYIGRKVKVKYELYTYWISLGTGVIIQVTDSYYRVRWDAPTLNTGTFLPEELLLLREK